MALIVEDGSGVEGAESYASVAQADERLASLGYTTWASGMITAEKEQALRRAAVYMTQMFRQLWKGSRVDELQALDWPREDVTVAGTDIGEDIVPDDIVNANIDLAFKAAHGDLLPDQTGGARLIRKKLGPLEQEFADKSEATPSYNAVYLSLSPYLLGGTGGNQVIR